jgi:hypothetical protein
LPPAIAAFIEIRDICRCRFDVRAVPNRNTIWGRFFIIVTEPRAEDAAPALSGRQIFSDESEMPTDYAIFTPPPAGWLCFRH